MFFSEENKTNSKKFIVIIPKKFMGIIKNKSNNLRASICVLFSGGKDSTAAVFELSKNYKIACLITIVSENPDSFMFHTPNINLTELQAKAMKIPLIKFATKGKKEKELSDLKAAIKLAKDKYSIEAVGVGALESQYQLQRIEKICKELDLFVLAPFWKKNIEKYMNYLLDNSFEIIFTGVAAEGFDKSWLRRKLDKNALEDLKKLNKHYKIHLAGEGGEYETFVLNCLLFKKKIKILDYDKILNKNSGKLVINQVELVKK